MKVTYNWLKDFVDISLAPQALADKLTMAGLEVKAIDRFEDDYVFEIEVTSNRPDWLSVIGIAREVAALTGKKLRVTKVSAEVNEGRRTNDKRRPKIFITDKKACPFYSARVISDVKIGASPQWMVKRLRAIGLRPVNNVVDITNYVLFATGQPLHAFDLDKIAGAKISVRFAQAGEEITTIDGIKRKLSPEILVIADENRPTAIAGIMGGKDTEVNESTKNILLESAYFSPLVTRKADRLLALSSDSSYRFERSVDMTRVVSSSDLAAGLILEYCQGKIDGLSQSGLEPKESSKAITFSLSQANKLIGREIPVTRAKAIFKTLEFKIGASKGDVLKLTPPGFRQDIKSDVDLLEELCRIYGYENIPLSLAAVRHQEIGAKPEGYGAASNSRSHKESIERTAKIVEKVIAKGDFLEEDRLISIRKKAREVLAALGDSEAITYSLLSRESLSKAGWEDFENIVCLENPLSSQQEILRPDLGVGLLGVLARNLELGNKTQGFFEMGDCFLSAKENIGRTAKIAEKVIVKGDFLEDGESPALGLIEEGGLLELKGKLELLLVKLGITDYSFANISYPLFSPGQSARLLVSDKEAGVIGQVSLAVLKNFKIDASQVVYCQLNLEALKPYVNFAKAYSELPRYPAVIRDLTLIVQEQIAYQGIIDLIKTARIEELEAIKFKDLYRAESLGPDKKAITISLEFRLPEATLTDSQVNGYMERIVQALTRNQGISLR